MSDTIHGGVNSGPRPSAMSSDMSSNSSTSASYSSRPRKSRQLAVPADSLLTFARYNPRPEIDQTPTRVTRRKNAPRRREQFVQANFRFAVDPSYDAGYADCFKVADAVIPWSAVDLVFLHHSHDCPICLHPLRCPRVTPCGHVFDFVCLLQHLTHSADSNGFGKCPLCFLRLCAEDLRACVFHEVTPLEVGVSFRMRLVSRERGHMIAHEHPTNCYQRIPRALSSNATLFSRLLVADESYLLDLTGVSIQDLRQTKLEDDNLAPFVETAMKRLKKDKYAYLMRRSARFLANPDHQHECKSPSGCKGKPPTARDVWYFYQAKDSRNIFLHPVNHRCLVTEVQGDFSRIDTEICGEVLQIERYTMNEQLRKRYRFLEHLPIGCEFCFIELDLSHIMSEETKAAHNGELKERKSARRKREIEVAREDELLERKQSESLHEYFSTTVELNTKLTVTETVDSRDVRSFPALRVNAGLQAESENEEDDAASAEIQAAEIARYSAVKIWGAEVSSYSSVTSNMGMFPSLKQTISRSSSAQGCTGDAHRHPVSTHSQTFADSAFPLHVSRDLFSASSGRRKGRKAHGRTTIILSNQGSPYRR